MSITENHTINRNPELKELIYIIRHEVQQAQRPPQQVILDDTDVMRLLKISKRKLQYLKSDRIIPYYKLEPDSPRTYYLLSDILGLLNRNRTDSIKSNL